MIQRIYIDNYKCLVNFELCLQELTLLLGPNGVGKTAILDVLFALRSLLTGEAKVADPGVFPARTLTRWQTQNIQVFELKVLLKEDELQYRLEVEHAPSKRKARIVLERLDSQSGPLFVFNSGEVQLYRDDHSAGPTFYADWSESALARIPPRNDNQRLTRFLEFMRGLVVCGLYPPGFETESHTEKPLLDREGRNFASWYRHVVLEQPDIVHECTTALQEVIEGFRGIRLVPVGEETRVLMVTFNKKESNESYELRFDEISDGQRALIALYSLVKLAGSQKHTLFLDEPDNYLALAEIQPWLMELKDACGETVPQAILCSHHPELIDYLGGEQGLWLKREISGATIVRRVSETGIEGGLKLSEVIARGWE